jgi:hypothetical protein
MRPKLETRLKELRTEYDTGQKQVQQLERQLLLLRETLLRIGGAILVLEEVLSTQSANQAGEDSTDSQPIEFSIVR